MAHRHHRGLGRSASWVTGWDIALDEGVHGVVEGCREEHALTVARGPVEEPLDGGQEAEVGHVVGLVEDSDLDRVEAHVPLTDEVLEPARAGDDDVDAPGECLDLRVLTDAAEDGARGEPGCRRERCESLVDLGGQLAGRREDEGTRTLRCAAGAAAQQTGDDRQEERIRLAGAGAAPAEDVTSGEAVRQGRGLDRGGGRDAALSEHGAQACGHAEVGEGSHGEVYERSDAVGSAGAVRELVLFGRGTAASTKKLSGRSRQNGPDRALRLRGDERSRRIRGMVRMVDVGPSPFRASCRRTGWACGSGSSPCRTPSPGARTPNSVRSAVHHLRQSTT